MQRDYKFKNRTSEDGWFDAKIPPEINRPLTEHCRMTNQNKTKYVRKAVLEKLKRDRSEELQRKTKEELVRIIEAMVDF